jgi:hypothetical protein
MDLQEAASRTNAPSARRHALVYAGANFNTKPVETAEPKSHFDMRCVCGCRTHGNSRSIRANLARLALIGASRRIADAIGGATRLRAAPTALLCVGAPAAAESIISPSASEASLACRGK